MSFFYFEDTIKEGAGPGCKSAGVGVGPRRGWSAATFRLTKGLPDGSKVKVFLRKVLS